MGLSCMLLSSCGINETTYDNDLAAPISYGSLTNPNSSVVLGVPRDPHGHGRHSAASKDDAGATGAVGTAGSKGTGDAAGSGATLDGNQGALSAATKPHNLLPGTDTSKVLTGALVGKDPLGGFELNFYERYGDNNLNALIERALSYNYDLRSAYLTLQKAEIQLGQARTNLHPTVSASLSSSARKDLSHGESTTHSSSANLGISYELDLFGKLDAQERSAWESFKASAYDYKAMRLTTIQRTCQYYWDYAFAQEALKLAEEQLAASFKRLEVIRAMRDSGAADGLEYDQALVNHRSVEQTVYQRGYELTSAHNALTTLLGWYSEEPLEQAITPMALDKTVSPKVEVSLPASLLQNRPDLMAYEARVRAAYANTDQATANFYPSFSLNAGVGSGSSTSLGRFLLDPVGSLGASLTLPFLNYNELSLAKESSLVDRDQARLTFAQGFINAVGEVSNALNELSYQERLQSSSQSEYALTKNNYERYEERYRYGSASLSDMLDASDNLRSAQNKLLSSKRDLLNASMTLMIALGGDSFAKPVTAPALAATVSTSAGSAAAGSATDSAAGPAAGTATGPAAGTAETHNSAATRDPYAILAEATDRTEPSLMQDLHQDKGK